MPSDPTPKVVTQAVIVEFDLADGRHLRREFSTADALPEWLRTVPDWLDNADRIWDKPQDPICFVGDVKPGREQEAQETMGVEPIPNRFGDDDA